MSQKWHGWVGQKCANQSWKEVWALEIFNFLTLPC